MWPESAEEPQPLRTGLTTGACATACIVAAVQRLLGGRALAEVEITLPRGQQVSMPIVSNELVDHQALAATIKDAGDDPDITHGATVWVRLHKADQGIEFRAGAGVGTVTKEGLVLAVGEPAINPVPRQMIRDHLRRYADFYDYHGGFVVTVGVEQGELLAQKTMNPRLGILGGLSILGTTGIVRPYSCAAWIASIRQGVDVASSNGFDHIAATTGSTSEKAVVQKYALPVMALIEMGDFAGALLKHLKKGQVKKLSLCGGFGKISKLANGHLDLHSRVSSIDLNHLADVAARQGADHTLQAEIRTGNTSIAGLKACQRQGIPLADAICELARQQAQRIVADTVVVEVFAVDRQGNFVGYAGEPDE
ncbi:MAG: cobalt-precorrin-5B (C(1))-methyltransferase [Marinobacterium sp.]|nr:cobalt-precorrin-5B (C(1))-methyltransferase [Marinobacterium sp.]